MKYLKIKSFLGVYSRNKIQNCTKEAIYVVNLDDNKGPGTQLVALYIKQHIIEF